MRLHHDDVTKDTFEHKGCQSIYILRGLPGSGKSTMAERLKYWLELDNSMYGLICSADDYFQRFGRAYQFDQASLPQAHAWCQGKALAGIEMGVDLIIDNTNTRLWEMQPYLDMADRYGLDLYVLEPNTPWARNVDELFKRNTHGVPREAIERMLDRWESYVS